MNNNASMLKGLIDLLILKLLINQDCYGYQLADMITEHSEGVLEIPFGSLYPSLYRLLEKGFISSEERVVAGRRRRVYYHLTEEGKAHFEKINEDYQQLHVGVQNILSYDDEKKE